MGRIWTHRNSATILTKDPHPELSDHPHHMQLVINGRPSTTNIVQWGWIVGKRFQRKARGTSVVIQTPQWSILFSLKLKTGGIQRHTRPSVLRFDCFPTQETTGIITVRPIIRVPQDQDIQLHNYHTAWHISHRVTLIYIRNYHMNWPKNVTDKSNYRPPGVSKRALI